MVKYHQIFLHTSYIHIHMGCKTIAKNPKNSSPVLGVVCAGVVSPDNDEHVLELGSAKVGVEDPVQEIHVYDQAKELLIKCQLICLLFYLMFGMNGKAPGSCNETKIIPTMIANFDQSISTLWRRALGKAVRGLQ